MQAEEHILGLQDGKNRFVREVSLLSQAIAPAIRHETALELKDDKALFQAIKAGLVKFETTGNGRSDDDIDSTIR